MKTYHLKDKTNLYSNIYTFNYVYKNFPHKIHNLINSILSEISFYTFQHQNNFNNLV